MEPFTVERESAPWGPFLAGAAAATVSAAVLLCIAGCLFASWIASPARRPSVEFEGFDLRLSSSDLTEIWSGRSKAEIRAQLGKPDAIVPSTNTTETWRYSSETEWGTLDVQFGSDGIVERVLADFESP